MSLRKSLLATLALPALLLLPTPPAEAAPKCTRDGAVVIARGGDVVIVGIRRKTRGNETRRDDRLACLASTGRRFKLFTSVDLGETLTTSDQFTFLPGRKIGVVRTAIGGASISRTGATYDVAKRKALFTTRKCDDFALGDDRGVQEIVFLPSGGIAFGCRALWVADAKGERQLEPDGTDVRQIAVSGEPYTPRLYWTVYAGDDRVLRSAEL